MKKSEIETLFESVYLSTVQFRVKLVDTMFIYCELGRASGKTTNIFAPRLDRVQNSMPGAILVIAASAYRDLFENILPHVIAYFDQRYERDIYFAVGREPPSHFVRCHTSIDSWLHTLSFVNGCVVQFVSADRPTSMLGKNAAHLFVDEMLRIPGDKFLERIIPALRADRSKYGQSPWFMGISGFSSTPNFETDEDWFLPYEKDMNPELIDAIQEIALEVDQRLCELEIARRELDPERIKKLERFVERWQVRLADLRRGQTFYIRASSFSNLKILGIEYLQNQIKSLKDPDMLNTSIFAIRKLKVKDMFFGKFSKEHLFDDGYDYRHIDLLAAGDPVEDHCRHLRYYKPRQPLYAGYDAGPFSSVVFAQRDRTQREFRILKNIWAHHPDQHDVLARKIDAFFSTGRREIILHYDRAANQRDPEYRKFYPLYREDGVNDTDAILLKKELRALGWVVHLMSVDQRTVFHSRHYRLLNLLFSKPKPGERRDRVLIDRNECEALVSSINHSPLKRHEGRLMLDKSSESLPFEEQAFNSTQLASALMYLLWGEYRKLLPASDRNPDEGGGTGTWM